MLCRLLPLLLLLTPAVAHAEWREAVSKHFIVYSEGSEAELRKSVLHLEKFDRLLRLMLDVPQDHPIKLRVYLVRDAQAVGRRWGTAAAQA